MKSVRAYAQDTKVPINQTRLEIERLLLNNGASRFFFVQETDHAMIGFFLKDRLIRVTLPLPVEGRGPSKRSVEQQQRARWRALHLILKARLEAIRAGISTVEREFLPDTVLPDGRTVHEWLEPQITIAFQEGEMPRQLTYQPKPQP